MKNKDNSLAETNNLYQDNNDCSIDNVKASKFKPNKTYKIENLTNTQDNSKLNNKKDKKTKIKKWTRRTTATFLVACILGITSGSIIGVWFRKNLLGGVPPVDYSQFNEITLRGNEIINEDLGLNVKYLTSTPNKNSLVMSFVAAEYNARHYATSYEIVSNGLVSTIAKQEIYAHKLWDGKNFLGYSVSSGLMSLGEVASYSIDDPNTIIVTAGSNISKKSTNHKIYCPNTSCEYSGKNLFEYVANFNGKQTTYKRNVEDTRELPVYRDVIGLDPDNSIPYIVSSKTLLQEQSYNFREVELEDGNIGYAYTLNLNPQSSVLNYVKQMKYLSKLDDLPVFTSVKLDIVLTMVDGRVYFKYLDISEEYSIKYGILTPKCNQNTHLEFNFNIDVTIPNL